MFEKYFAEFHVPEQELKEEIYSTLQSLNIIDPENWPLDLLEYADPSKSSQEILIGLINFIPSLSEMKPYSTDLELIETLRLSAIGLKMILNGKRLDYLFIKQLYMIYSDFFLGIRYLLAAEILSVKLNKELIYDMDKVFSILTNASASPVKLSYKLTAAKAAHEEIARLYEDDTAKQYVQYISDYEAAIEKYIKDNHVGIVLESFSRLSTEAFIKNVGIINTNIQLGEAFSSHDVKSVADGIFKTIRQNTNRRLGRTRGGNRDRKGFRWTIERQVAFYKMVESLPKIQNSSCWQFALDELIEQEFNGETINWLKTHPAFMSLPDSLFRNAIMVWRKYLVQENWKQMKREEKPRSFEFRHALYLLDYPDKFTFSTLKTHHVKGKKMAGDFQKET